MVSKSMHNMAAELLKCTICYDSFKSPKVLPCLHTFCEECLQQHIDVNTRNKILGRTTSSPSRINAIFPCPTCREQVRVPSNGVEGFRHDFRVTQFQDWLNQSSSSISTSEEDKAPQTSDPSTCHFCKSTNKESVTSYCKVCKKWLCEKCADRHQRKAIFSDHVIVSSNEENHVEMDSSECETHRGEHIAYICLKCNTGVCSVCTMTSHDSHAVTDLLSGLRGYHDNLECLQQALIMRVSQLFHFMKDVTSQEKTLQQERTQTITNIKSRTQELIKNLREQERMLINEIETRYRTETDKLCTSKNEMELTIVSMESLREFSSDLLQKKNSLQLLPIYQDLTQRMDRILEDSLQLKTSYLHTNWKFVPSKAKCKLGKLKYTETNNNLEEDVSNICNIASFGGSKLLYATALSKIGCHGNKLGEFDSPRDITFLLDGNFVVADTSNNRLQVFTADGSLVGVIGQGHIKPWGIATTIDGNIAVADALDKCVKIFSPTGVLLAKFGQFLCPCGIAVDQSGDIFVTDFFSTSIYVLSTLGAMLQKHEFRDRNDRHASGASRIAISRRGTIIVSDISNCCVKIFNLSGKLLSKITKPDILGTPHGVATDANDNIYVGEMSKNQVVVLNPNGKYLHQLFSGHELKDPLGIAISQDNILVLSEGKTNTVGIYRLTSNPHLAKQNTSASLSE